MPLQRTAHQQRFPRFLQLICVLSITILSIIAASQNSFAQVVVPGTGQRSPVSGDTFEDKKWSFTHNFPKSSHTLDQQVRYPLGVSKNGRWQESAKRGQPDIIRRVATPKNGIPGSKGALLLRTLNSGIPRFITRTSQQDDLLFEPQEGAIPAAMSPSVVVRVYLPPFDQWENRTDTSFGFRLGVETTTYEIKRSLFRKKRVPKSEMFYPGIFIQYNAPRAQNGLKKAKKSATFIIRGNQAGQDVAGPVITQTGWWTLGISLSPNGQLHYFANPGVGKLTQKHRIHSAFYAGHRMERYHTFFFDIVSRNDAKTWSTAWIIDDPYLYYKKR